MAHYLDWVCTTQLPTKDCKSIDTEILKVAAHDLQAELYVLGKSRLDSRLRSAIIIKFIRLRLVFHDIPKCQPSRRVGCINTIYQGTSAELSARRLMVDLSLRSGCPQCYKDNDLVKAFLVDLTQASFGSLREKHWGTTFDCT
jgi:hypothetical protein